MWKVKVITVQGSTNKKTYCGLGGIAPSAGFFSRPETSAADESTDAMFPDCQRETSTVA